MSARETVFVVVRLDVLDDDDLGEIEFPPDDPEAVVAVCASAAAADQWLLTFGGGGRYRVTEWTVLAGV